MTDFPFSGPDGGADPGGGNRRTLVLAGALVAVLAVGGGVLLLGGSSDIAATPVPVPGAARHTVPPVVGTPTPAPTLAVVPVAAPGRNPYKALYVVPAGAGAAGAAGAGSTGGGTTGSPAPAPVATPTATASEAAPYPLKLVGITVSTGLGNNAFLDWLVDGVKVRTLDGQRFGKTGELVVLTVTRENPTSGPYSAWVQVGTATPVEVVVGRTVQVL